MSDLIIKSADRTTPGATGAPPPAAPGPQPGPRARARPEPLLAAVAILLVAAVAMTAGLSDWMLRQSAHAAARQRAGLVAGLVAQQLCSDPANAPARFAAVCAALVPPGGHVLNVTLQVPGQPPQPWRPVDASVLRPAGSATATTDLAPGRPEAGRVVVEVGESWSGGATAWLLGGGAGVLAVALCLYALLYRRLRERLQPLEAIAEGLDSYAAGLERDLHTLCLSDSLGTMSKAWNGLLRELTQLRRQTSDGAGSGDVLAQFERRELQSTLDAIPCGVLRLDESERINFANATACELLRHEAERVTGAGLPELIGPELARQVLAGGATRGGRRFIDHDFSTPDDPRMLRFERRRGRSKAEGALVFIQDITHLKEAERTRDNFLYHVTHELRTPLTNIAAYAETLGKPDFDDEQTRKECYNVIISETKRLSSLIEDILNISQMEVGTLQMEWTAIDFPRLARKVVQDNLGAADEKGIELALELAPKLPQVRGDKHRLSILLSNLIGNAIKYTPAGGKVRVTAEADEAQVHVAVHDTGIGIPESEQANVFEKFYRVHCDEVQAQKGTGIGLAICREVVALHGGDIRVRSKPGHGSTFMVDIPIGDLSASLAPAGAAPGAAGGAV